MHWTSHPSSGIAAGHRLLADGSPTDALTELDQALDLWRGDVLADLADFDFVQPAATRLADKRLAALEAKFDAELALGRHANVLAELNEVVARYPLNEQLQRQRMLALYRCGRASDALVAYDHLRRQLVDELSLIAPIAHTRTPTSRRTAMAQALVQQSRTAGQEVTVWGGADQDGSERVTRYVASVLAQLGYRPAVHLTPTQLLA